MINQKNVKSQIVSVVLMGLLFLRMDNAFAEEKLSTPGVIEPMSMGSVIQVFAGLAAVLLLFGVIVFVLKRLGGFKTTNGGKMRMVDGVSIGTRERVLLMQVGDKQVLIGVTPHQINPLHVFDEPVISVDQPQQGFASLLQKKIKDRMQNSSINSNQTSSKIDKGDHT